MLKQHGREDTANGERVDMAEGEEGKGGPSRRTDEDPHAVLVDEQLPGRDAEGLRVWDVPCREEFRGGARGCVDKDIPGGEGEGVGSREGRLRLPRGMGGGG